MLQADKINPANDTECQPEFKKIQDYIYRFSDQIGMGNFSKVFKGVHQTSNKQVAIKIIQLNSLTNARLQQLLNSQTKILKMLSHPNVIGCEQILSSVRNCYIITELCNGGDLEKRLRKMGHFKEKDIYQAAVDIYEGLKYLGKKNIIHRDIKASNIFINRGIHKIADFGFAHISEVQFKDISVGSPIYMSPEGYIQNIYGPKTDVWAFGVLLFELIQGKTPCFDCRTESQLKNRLLQQIDNNSFTSHCSNELKNLIIQCLDVNPANRIKIQDIEHTAWMKKAVNLSAQARNMSDKENNYMTEKFGNTYNSNSKYRKISEDLYLRNGEHKGQANKSHDIKSYLERVSNLIKNNDKFEEESKRKHSTLDKTKVKDDSWEKDKDEGKAFYSPKNTLINNEKNNNGVKNNPNPLKFQSFSIGNHLSSPQSCSLKIKSDLNSKPYAPSSKQDKLKTKPSWIEKLTCRQGRQTPSEKEQAHNKDSKNILVNHLLEQRDKLDDKEAKKMENTKSQKKQLTNPVIGRKLKFSDCIGIIHYCRLCYKFACLLDESGESVNFKNFLTAWSVQLLTQVNLKIDSSEVIFSHDNGGDIDKKKKLRDVTQQYLQKYSKSAKFGEKNLTTIKQASTFIYNIYIQKGCEYKQKTKDKKPYLYYALIGYISLLDRETRNLMEFLYEIKNSMECKQVQKLLSVKITDFSQKLLQQITCETETDRK